MHPRVTLQLPAAPHVRPPAIDLRGARCVLIGHGYVAAALSPALPEQAAQQSSPASGVRQPHCIKEAREIARFRSL